MIPSAAAATQRSGKHCTHNTQELVPGPVRVQFNPDIGPSYRGRCESVCSLCWTYSTMQLTVRWWNSTVQSQRNIHKGVYTTALETLLNHAGCFFLPLISAVRSLSERAENYHNCTGGAWKYSDWNVTVLHLHQCCIQARVPVGWVYRRKALVRFSISNVGQKKWNVYKNKE